MDAITITVDDQRLQRALSQAQQRLADTSPLMADIGERLLESTRERFDRGVAPDGTPWVPLRDGSGRTPLNLTRTMRDQIFPASGRDYVEIAATAKQARWHQLGTDPYTIEPRTAGGRLRFPGPDGGFVFRRRVNHPGLPARPFLGVSDADVQAIDALVGAYLDLEG